MSYAYPIKRAADSPATELQWKYIRLLVTQAHKAQYYVDPDLQGFHPPEGYTLKEASQQITALIQAKSRGWK